MTSDIDTTRPPRRIDYSFNSKDIPEREPFLSIFAELRKKQILALPNMAWDEAEMEVWGRWVDDSTGFYPASAIDKFVRQQRLDIRPSSYLPTTAVRAIIGCDIARGGQRGKGDDSSVIGGFEPMPPALPCMNFAWRCRSLTKRQLSGVIHELVEKYRKTTRDIVIVLDPQGGGTDLLDELKHTTQVYPDGSEHQVEPITTLIDVAPGSQRLVIYAQKDDFSQAVFGQTPGGNGWIENHIHKRFSGAVQNNLFETVNSYALLDGDLSYLAMMRSYEIEKIVNDNRKGFWKDPDTLALIELNVAFKQLLYIGLKLDEHGIPVQGNYGLDQFVKLGNKRTDSAMAMIFWWYGVLFSRMRRPLTKPSSGFAGGAMSLDSI